MSAQRTHLTRPDASILRHVCTACGGCCQGVRVPVYDRDRQAILDAGKALDVPDPIDGGALRMVDGQCVFLGSDRHCRIHATLGSEAKPTPCRQFPIIAVHTPEGVRVGVDPASYGAWRTWQEGDPVPEGPVVATRTPPPGGQLAVEQHLVAMAEDPQATLTGLLAVLVREPVDRGVVPPQFATRWLTRLQDIDLQGFLAHQNVGPALRAALTPLAEAVPLWTTPPPMPELDPELHAWAVEAFRRSLFLRLTPGIPNVSAAALLHLGGLVAGAWVDPSPEAYARFVTGWLRALRFDAFWQRLAKDKDTLVWLGTGSRP